MDPPPKKKSKKDILAENLIEMIDRNPSSAALLLLTVVLLPWSMDFVSPSLKFLCVVLGPHIWKGTGTAWRGTADWMTQPMLFVLMNLMIFSIMLSSGTLSLASTDNGNNSREKHSTSAMRSASSKEQQNIFKGGLVRSQSISEELVRKDCFPSNLSFDSQASEGGKSTPPRHSRSLSLPLTEAENWSSTSSFSTSTSKQHQSPSMQAQSIPETYREQKLLRTVESSSRFAVQNEEEDEANFVNIHPLMKVERRTTNGCIDPRRFKEEREANVVNIKPYVEKKTANGSTHPRRFKEANAVNIKPAMNTEKKAYGWAARRGSKEEDEGTFVDNRPVFSVGKMTANACVDPTHLDWQNHFQEKQSSMHTNSTSEVLLEPRTGSFAQHSSSSEKDSSSSALLQTSREISDMSSVAVDNENRWVSPSDEGSMNKAAKVNEKDELNVRIEAFLARHRRQRQQEMIESLQFSRSKTGTESKPL